MRLPSETAQLPKRRQKRTANVPKPALMLAKAAGCDLAVQNPAPDPEAAGCRV